MSLSKRPIGIIYEHPVWFKPLFNELDKRKIPYVRIHAANHQYNPAEREVPYSLVVNRVSSSAYLRGNSQGIYHAANYLAHVERLGTPVVNGTAAQLIESSRARQLELLASLGLKFPKTRIINNTEQLIAAASSLRFPIVVKTNLIGSSQSILRFNTVTSLQKAVRLGQLNMGIDHTALVQEFIPAKGGEIIRVETINHKFLYALKVFTKTESYNLRPAELCTEQTPCWINAPKNQIKVEAFSPPQRVIEDVERIVKNARLDAGAVEYVVSERDGEIYYCNLIGLSNFVNDPVNVIGFDPNEDFVDYIEARLKPAYDAEPVLAI
ncbi:MAG: hypothetical protein EBR30_10205 [Cytophagia bacterium]|nr:hypothetical protein [Cytophagia bacterium]NBW35370.1 hypothetical protein [Cytophagia bacterium]